MTAVFSNGCTKVQIILMGQGNWHYLDWYYFGARCYDPQIGRWLSVDPLASLTPDLTPYHYVRNNPINRIDPFGLSHEDPPYVGETPPIVVYPQDDPFEGWGAENGSAFGSDNTLAEKERDNIYYNEGVKTFSESFNWRFMFVDGVGLGAKFKTETIVNIIKINGIYYAVVSVNAKTPASNKGYVQFFGNTSLMSGENILSTNSLQKGPPAIRGSWSEVGQTQFRLPNNSSNDISLNIEVNYIFKQGDIYASPLPGGGSYLIKIGTHIDMLNK